MVEFARFTPPAVDIQISRLQSEAQVLLRLAREPLNLFGNGRLIFLDVGQFEEALVNPCPADSQHSQFPRHVLGFTEPIQTHVGVQFTTTGLFGAGYV